MPDIDTHLAAAGRNKACIDRLRPHISDHPEWVATIAFYQALHVVEAAFAAEKPDHHSEKHKDRLERLKGPRYAHIFKEYRPLYVASLVARYLQDGRANYPSFSDYLPADQVEGLLIKTHLKRIQDDVSKIVGRTII